MDYLHKSLKWIDYNRYKVIALIILAMILITGIGCESLTASLTDPAVKIDRQQLSSEIAIAESSMVKRKIQLDAAVAEYNADVDVMNKQIDAAVAEIDRQDQIKAELFDIGGSLITGWAAGGGVPTDAIVGTALTVGGLLFGLGSAADSRRKDKVIESKTPTKTA